MEFITSVQNSNDFSPGEKSKSIKTLVAPSSFTPHAARAPRTQSSSVLYVHKHAVAAYRTQTRSMSSKDTGASSSFDAFIGKFNDEHRRDLSDIHGTPLACGNLFFK
jgi:RecA-family ATPase